MTRLPEQHWMTSAPTRRLFAALEAVGGPDCARFVGGCVRNTLMGRAADDVDVATKLTPDQTLKALTDANIRAVPTGIEHGTVTAVIDHIPYEVTSLRRDVETDGRRAVVAFSTDWAEDAQRRDFRLNALYADLQGEVFDPVGGGIEDALEGRIVFVGDPETRLREDHLRNLRFFRFFAWYGSGEPDPAGLAACRKLREGLRSLSAERISKELIKLLSAPDPVATVRLMASAAILEQFLPDGLNLDRFAAMVAITPDPVLRLSALLPDDPTTVGAVADSLRLSNADRDRLLDALPSAPPVHLDLKPAEARAGIYQLGTSAFEDRVRRAWAEAPARSDAAKALLGLAKAWPKPRFPLGGADVMALGVPAGPRLGMLLREVETWWIAHDFPAEGARERLVALIGEAR
ncbi:MAG: CCA tRNA nucleotidyltransferase [Proteobacteria bacterium]|nr:CCA tRNA nucleotidyltransferase [Pseudomonadota bacterium]